MSCVRPPADPAVMRAQMDADWERTPAVDRIGAESAVRRERLGTRVRSTPSGLAGTSARSVAGMAALRTKLNSLRSAEQSSGNNSPTVSSVFESARSSSEPFVPKSSVTVAVTPSNKGTFETRVAPIASECGVPFIMSRGSYRKFPVQAMTKITSAVKGDATAEDMAALQVAIDKSMSILDIMNKQEKVNCVLKIEDSPSNPGKKQLAVYIFVREEGADVVADFVKDVGEDLFGHYNPLMNHMDCLLEGFKLKVETGESLTDTMVSRDAVMKPLGNMRVTATTDFSSELANYLYPTCLQNLMELSGGGRRGRQAQERVQAALSSTLPLMGVRDIKSHVTYDSPEHLMWNLLRQLSFLRRAQGDPVPGSTFVETAIASSVLRRMPIGATGLGVWNFMNHIWMGAGVEDDELLLTQVAHAAAKVAGPISTVQMEGKLTSALITVEGVDPAAHAFTSMEEHMLYFDALRKATRKPDPFRDALTTGENFPRGGSEDEDGEGSDAGSDVSSVPSVSSCGSSPAEKANYEWKSHCVGLFKKLKLNKDMFDEDDFGVLGFQQPMQRTHKQFHNLGTYNQKVTRRNAAVCVVLDGEGAKKIARCWSTDNRLDTDVYGENDGDDSAFLGRYITPDGRSVVFTAVDSVMYDTSLMRSADALVCTDTADEHSTLEPPQTPSDKENFQFLYETNSEVYHVRQGNTKEESKLFTQSWNVPTLSSDDAESTASLISIRDSVVAAALARHPNTEPSCGFDYPYTQILTLGKAVVKANKMRKKQAGEEGMVGRMGSDLLAGSSGSWSSDE